MYNKKEIDEHLIAIKKKEKSANHYCYAYVLKPDRSFFKMSDDGEPASTAGKPILTQIKKHQLTNILVVVVRYFGGKKLGIPGLIRAYKSATLDAIQNSRIIPKKIREQYEIEFNYIEMNNLMGIIKKYNIEIFDNVFKDKCFVTINILKNESDKILMILKKNKNLKVRYKTLI